MTPPDLDEPVAARKMRALAYAFHRRRTALGYGQCHERHAARSLNKMGAGLVPSGWGPQISCMARQLSFFRRLGCGRVNRARRRDSARASQARGRPIDVRGSLHVVLRSGRARESWSLRKQMNANIVEGALRRFTRRFGLRVYGFANAGNHVHILLRSPCRLAVQNFLRAFAGVVARRVTGARKGWAVGRFWDFLSYSRIVRWGRDFRGVRSYVVQNELEALRLVPYRARSHLVSQTSRRLE